MTKYEVDFRSEDWPDKLMDVLDDLSLEAELVLNTMDLLEESIDREINSLKKSYGDEVAHLGKHPDSLFYLTGECKDIVKNIRDLIGEHTMAMVRADKVWDRLNINMAEIPEITAKRI